MYWITHTPIFWLAISLVTMKFFSKRLGVALLVSTWLHLGMDWYGGADGIPVPSDEGMLFFKASAAETVFEIALTQKLAEWFPDCMPELVAADTARGWMLMRDGGEQLRIFIRPTQDIRPWKPVITRYAEIQIELAKHVDEVLALGAPDHRLAALPALYSQLLADEASLMIDQEKGLTSAELRQLQNLTPRFEQICTDLAALGIPESINHGDFHDGNVLLKNGRITFFDWGDATVTEGNTIGHLPPPR